MNEIEEACRQRADDAGIDVRTSYFAGCLRRGLSPIHELQDLTRLQPEQIERVLTGFLSERYADWSDRRAHGLDFDCSALNFVLSQGYKWWLKWRGVPLGKTCWDISIYQQLIQNLRPKTLIELGTGLGGSTLFFLDHCRMFGLGTRIITLDVNIDDISPEVFKERAIEFIGGDIKDLAELLPAQRLRDLPHPWLIVEDCHNHVPLIVSHLQPLMASGDYLVIEDIGVNSEGSAQIEAALQNVPKGNLMVDTFYTDLFGRNLTCSPDAIFRKT
jgi:cephalosporin hydroxylase